MMPSLWSTGQARQSNAPNGWYSSRSIARKTSTQGRAHSSSWASTLAARAFRNTTTRCITFAVPPASTRDATSCTHSRILHPVARSGRHNRNAVSICSQPTLRQSQMQASTRACPSPSVCPCPLHPLATRSTTCHRRLTSLSPTQWTRNWSLNNRAPAPSRATHSSRSQQTSMTGFSADWLPTLSADSIRSVPRAAASRSFAYSSPKWRSMQRCTGTSSRRN